MIMASPLLGTVIVAVTLVLVLALRCSNCSNITSKVPALFVFGDSLLDTGNNDGLLTIARPVSPPYGQDLTSTNGSSSSSGGRFSNGPITTDFIAASLSLPSPPPYVSAGDNIEHGVNFASAASGILEVTGNIFGEHYSMPRQIRNFEDVKNRLEQKVGTAMSSSIISKAIFYITTGSNDYFLTYYSRPPNPLYATLSPGQFSDLLISQLNEHLQNLYEVGARKFAVTAIPPIGCTPYALWQYPNNTKDEDGCISFMKEDVHTYNTKIFSSIQTLQQLYSDAHFIYNNATEAALQIYKNPTHYGIRNVDKACCESQGGLMPGILCLRGARTCANASHYFFFDGFHPTSNVHHLTALTYVNGASPFVYPVNLQTLASTG